MMVDADLHGPVAPHEVAAILEALRMTAHRDLAGWDRPLTRAMRTDGQPASLDDYVAAGRLRRLWPAPSRS